MKIQYKSIAGQPSNDISHWCERCCFPNRISMYLYGCSVKSFKRTNGDIFKL